MKHLVCGDVSITTDNVNETWVDLKKVIEEIIIFREEKIKEFKDKGFYDPDPIDCGCDKPRIVCKNCKEKLK